MSDVSFSYAWPDNGLRGRIFVYWEVAIGAGEPVRDLLLPYWATMRFPISGDWLFGESPEAMALIGDAPVFHGLTGRAQWIGGQGGRAFCVVLFPMIWQCFPRTRADTYADRLCPLSDLIGGRAQDLHGLLKGARDFEERVALCNQWFGSLVAARPDDAMTHLIGKLTQAIADPDTDNVAMLAERLDISSTQLMRLSKRYFGFPPKVLLRRERFLRMLFTMERRPYAEWREFIDDQYTDQSHMIRDFRDFTGLSPNQYFDLGRPILSVAAVEIRKLLARTDGPIHPTAKRFDSDA